MITIEDQRKALAGRVFDQGFHWRVLFLGRSINGATDIVSSLSRSLRNLGHHVLDLDIKHAKITDNPQRVAGGHGPIYVRAADLQGVLENFRPQIIVCCAGGLTFTPEDAAALKAKGVVLVGLTLSDPDVFPSVHKHVDVFDVHTTNAELSLDMYREAGVMNTVYFPFAIDRGFVTQKVADAPDLAADVICLGHAGGRPERNSTMSALAEQFAVRTYGRGWDIPGSITVAGDRALQALKMGRIHVNFPLTRAGYVNIKCGVFESVGSGAVIATGRFPEMERFFRYGEEIIGYDTSEDLARQIEWLLTNPQEYERIRSAGFARLVGEHLYEHRWMTLFGLLRNASYDATPWLSPGRSAEVRRILAASVPRARRVLVSGFYGAGNLGDELILRSISSSLERADAGAQVVVAGQNARNVELQHGLQAFRRTDLYEAAHQLRSARAVVVGGGGLWHDMTFARAGGLASLVSGASMSIAGFGNLPLMGRVLGLPYHVVGMGVGPLQDPEARSMIKFLCDQTASILVRDRESAELLVECGVPRERVREAPDVVYAVPLPRGGMDAPVVTELLRLKNEGHRIVGINLRKWQRADMAVVVEEVAQAVGRLAAAEQIAVLTIPMQSGSTHDAAILSAVAGALPSHVPVVALPDGASLDLFTTCLDQLDALLSMRLHAALLAHRLRVPTLGLAYDPKVQRHFDEVCRTGKALPLDSNREVIAGALSELVNEGRISEEGFLGAVRRLEGDAASELNLAARLIMSNLATGDVVHLIPPERPSEVASADRPAPKASFTPAVNRAVGLELPERGVGVLMDLPNALQLALPTEEPQVGQQILMQSALRFNTREPVEVAITLDSRYERPQNRDRIETRVRVGDFVFVDDLARSKTPVLLRYRSKGESEVPVEISLTVKQECHPAASWPKYSRVVVRITGAVPISDSGPAPCLFTSNGEVRASERKVENAP